MQILQAGVYKVYIIADADLMSVQAQNALLKTIEEPPAYAVIMLLTENAEVLLPTIRSRCVMMKLRNIKDQLVKKYLMEQMEIPDYKARTYAWHLPREIWERPSCWRIPSILMRSRKRRCIF